MDVRKASDRRDSINITGTTARWWSLREDAVKAAERIGWPRASVTPVHNLMCRAFALRSSDGQILTREQYTQLCESLRPPSSR
jgi:hypothetical protein